MRLLFFLLKKKEAQRKNLRQGSTRAPSSIGFHPRKNLRRIVIKMRYARFLLATLRSLRRLVNFSRARTRGVIKIFDFYQGRVKSKITVYNNYSLLQEGGNYRAQRILFVFFFVLLSLLKPNKNRRFLQGGYSLEFFSAPIKIEDFYWRFHFLFYF